MHVIRSASLAPLRKKRIAVIGYGSQGRAQALNLRDAGFPPVVGLPQKSKSRLAARRDRMGVVSIREAARHSDIVIILAPDHVHGTLFRREITPLLHPGQMVVFAHASSVHFGLVELPAFVDVALVAPMGPGRRLRELRGQRDGVMCFFAIHQNATGKAHTRGLALAKAIGCLPAGAVETTFANEAIGDLFGEQAVLCGGLAYLLQAGVETLVRNGARPAHAYLECVYQLDFIVDLIKSSGVAGMLRQISPTASYGAHIAGPRVISPSVRKAMESLYHQIASGAFMRRWVNASRGPKIPRTLSEVFLGAETEVFGAMRSSRRRFH